MAFGSFTIEVRQQGEKPVEKELMAKSVPKEGKTSLSIILVGRTQKMMREYLCSMKRNMDEALVGSSLTFYTKEHRTITEIVAANKELDNIFWEAKDENWVREAARQEENPERYIFSISPAGKQTLCLEICFTCITPEASERAFDRADAVWILTDVPGMEEDDEYIKAVRSLVSELSGKAETESGFGMFFLISYFEHRARFQGSGAETILPAPASKRLYELWKQNFGAYAEKKGVGIYMVQVYGGLNYAGRNEKGELLWQIGRNGYYQKYVPVCCHLPVYGSIDRSREFNDFFEKQEGSFLWSELQKSFAVHLGEKEGFLQDL